MKVNVPTGISREALSLLLKGGRDIREAAVQIVCRGFCEYLNGRGGESECRGFSAILAGLKSGKLDPTHLSHLISVEPAEPWRSGCLVNELCSRCGYLKDGCDFMANPPVEGATPCGGYRLLQNLLECKALTPDLVRMLISRSDRKEVTA